MADSPELFGGNLLCLFFEMGFALVLGVEFCATTTGDVSVRVPWLVTTCMQVFNLTVVRRRIDISMEHRRGNAEAVFLVIRYRNQVSPFVARTFFR